MKKLNKGFTLVEVIVALTVIGISLSVLVLSYASYQKTRLKIATRSNIINVVDNLFNEFTSDPIGFSDNDIYYNNYFTTELETSTNYIELTKIINTNTNIIKLTVKVYVEGEPYLETSRSVHYEEE